MSFDKSWFKLIYDSVACNLNYLLYPTIARLLIELQYSLSFRLTTIYGWYVRRVYRPYITFDACSACIESKMCPTNKDHFLFHFTINDVLSRSTNLFIHYTIAYAQDNNIIVYFIY